MNETKHAAKVVEHFKSLLDEGTIAKIGEEHFNQLQLMIESAIDASTIEILQQAREIAGEAASRIDHLIEKI